MRRKENELNWTCVCVCASKKLKTTRKRFVAWTITIFLYFLHSCTFVCGCCILFCISLSSFIFHFTVAILHTCATHSTVPVQIYYFCVCFFSFLKFEHNKYLYFMMFVCRLLRYCWFRIPSISYLLSYHFKMQWSRRDFTSKKDKRMRIKCKTTQNGPNCCNCACRRLAQKGNTDCVFLLQTTQYNFNNTRTKWNEEINICLHYRYMYGVWTFAHSKKKFNWQKIHFDMSCYIAVKSKV